MYGLYEQRASFIAIINATGVNDKGVTYPAQPYGMEEDKTNYSNNQNSSPKTELEIDKEYRQKLIATQMF